jgi:hypothetical protein
MAATFRPLFVIRTAMVSGVIVLAVGPFVMRQRGLIASPPAETQGLMRTMALVAAGIAVAIVLALRARLGDADPGKARSLTIVGWAAGEFAAMAGLACYLLTGAQAAAAPGLLVFALAMVLFPVPRA